MVYYELKTIREEFMMDDLFEMLTQFLTEKRMSQVLEQDEEYRAARLHEREVRNRFVGTLKDEQVKLFHDFISAVSETNANIERVNYQQGMKDLFAVLKALSK